MVLTIAFFTLYGISIIKTKKKLKTSTENGKTMIKQMTKEIENKYQDFWGSNNIERIRDLEFGKSVSKDFFTSMLQNYSNNENKLFLNRINSSNPLNIVVFSNKDRKSIEINCVMLNDTDLSKTLGITVTELHANLKLKINKKHADIISSKRFASRVIIARALYNKAKIGDLQAIAKLDSYLQNRNVF